MDQLVIFTHEEIRQMTKDFDAKRTIGKPGAFGQVYKGRMIKGLKCQHCPKRVAVKISKIKNKYVQTMWKQEIASLSSVVHNNVIKLVGYAESDDYYGLVYERARRDLQEFTPPDKNVLDGILLGVACGLEAIHKAGFVHWDIQSRNILLMKNGTVKVADFGLATKRNEKMVYFDDRRVGNFNPNDTEAAQEKFDVYCFGSSMRELILREMAEWSPTKCPRRVLVDKCTVSDPDMRPSMSEVVFELEKIKRDEQHATRCADIVNSEPSSVSAPSKRSKGSPILGSFLVRKKSK